MGADLCLFCINTPKGKQPNYERARKFIDSFTVESLTEHPGLDELENISTEDTGVWTLIGDYHDGEGKISVKDVQGTARDWLKGIEGAFDSGRDCTVFETATETIWITGGMTWGDEPSPTSGLLDKLDALGVVAHLFYDAPSAEIATDNIVTHWQCFTEDCSEHRKTVDVPLTCWHGDFGNPICEECDADLTPATTVTVTP